MKIRQIKLRVSDPLPMQLIVRGGKLICVDGSEPDFSEHQDGNVNLVGRDYLEQLRNDAFLARCGGA